METYRGFTIERTDPVPPIPGWRAFAFTYTHKDYDGTEDGNDHRHGYAGFVDACKAAIDEIETDRLNRGASTCLETAYGSTVRLSFQVRVF